MTVLVDHQEFAARQFGGLGVSTVVAVRHLNPGGDHLLDGDERAPAAGDSDFQSAVYLLGCELVLQRDLVHVDQVLPQGFEIDLRPVGLGVGVEDADDSLARPEGVLAGQRRRPRDRVHTSMTAHHAPLLAPHLLHVPRPYRVLTERNRGMRSGAIG
jgi:hypothetical protein